MNPQPPVTPQLPTGSQPSRGTRASTGQAPVRTPGSPVSVSAAASLALMGDALLYAVLPTQAPTLGVPLVFVGLLLSVNRFVRLVTNTWASRVFRVHGREWPFFIAMMVAALTTFAYGLPVGPWGFLIARILWGTCWSFLNLGMYLSVLDYSGEAERGRWMGRIKAISRVGTIVAVILGGYLTDVVGFRSVVLTLGIFALAGAFVSLRDARKSLQAAHASLTDEPADFVLSPERASNEKPSVTLLYGMGFIFGLIMNGIVVGTMALLVVQRYGDSVGLFGALVGAATLSGLLLGARWVIEILLGPVAGSIGDRFGTDRILPIVAVLQAAMLTALAFTHNPYLLIPVALVVFCCGVTLAVCLDAVVGRVAIETKSVDKVMRRYVTAQDLGSAVGPLVGYLVGIGLGLEGLYSWASVLLVGVALVFIRQAVSRRMPSCVR